MEIRLLTASEIECRVGAQEKCDNPKWCTLLLYKDARCDYKILDELFGTFGWQCSYEVINNNLFCTIKIFDRSTGQWICKQNVGTESSTEKEKGEASDALKRAAFAVGIGRELYTAPTIFIDLQKEDCKNGKVTNRFFVQHIAYSERKISELVIVDKNNNTRFSMGVTQAKKKLPMSNTASKASIEEAIKEAELCKTQQELVEIWNKYPALHTNSKFKSTMTATKIKIQQDETAA